jgi:hypothetical protein
MALADVAALAADVDFKAKVKAAAAKKAYQLASDLQKNDEEVSFAVQLLQNPDAYVDAIAYDVAAKMDGLVTDLDTDSEIKTQVDNVIRAMSRR